MKINKIISNVLFLCVCLFAGLNSNAQTQKTDSINKDILVLEKNANFSSDTTYFNSLNDLASAYNNVNPDSTISIALKFRLFTKKQI